MNQTNQENQEWEEKFDKEFLQDDHTIWNEEGVLAIKDFIRNLLLSQESKIRKDVIAIISKRMVDSTTLKEIDFGEYIIKELYSIKQ